MDKREPEEKKSRLPVPREGEGGGGVIVLPKSKFYIVESIQQRNVIL